MSTHIKSAIPPVHAIAALVFLSVWASPVQAEKIVAMVDEHGHTIYVNAPDDSNSAQPGRNFRPVKSVYAIPPAEVDQVVVKAAADKQVDPKLVHSIIQVESGYDPNAVSRKGAMGLMQLIPDTARRFGVNNPFDPVQNVQGGVTYLKYLLDMFKGDVTLSLAAYNAGENSVLRSGGVPAFRETQDYVRKVNSLYSGEVPGSQLGSRPAEPSKPKIYRYVDEHGIVHFTNGQDF